MSSGEVIIGFRDPEFNPNQYRLYAEQYIAGNLSGERGGKTPFQRVEVFKRLLPPGRTVFEIGPGAGHDAEALVKTGYQYIGGDVAEPFVEHLRVKGFNTFIFDARKDPFPINTDGMYAHISAPIHMIPRDFARLLTSAREALNHEKAVFVSVVDGFGHERSQRTGGFPRDFVYYTTERFAQILDQEGLEIDFMEPVTAINNTPTIHAGGIFKSRRHTGSYGERGLHPFGDVYYTTETLFRGNLINDLTKAQVKAGFLTENSSDFIKAAQETYNRGRINYHQLVTEINNEWAKALAGRDINQLIEHTKEFFVGKNKFRALTLAALAVCNNNGFSNNLVGCEPSWLMNVIANQLKVDYISSAQWMTAPQTHLSGEITGEVVYIKGLKNSAAPALKHQRQLASWLGLKYKRITIGVGQIKKDRSLLANTDFPVFAFPPEEEIAFARQQGFFTDEKGEAIYADSWPWLKWAVIDSPEKFVKYLNMITSGRFPIQPNPFFNGLLWTERFNKLNTDYYRTNPDLVHIL